MKSGAFFMRGRKIAERKYRNVTGQAFEEGHTPSPSQEGKFVIKFIIGVHNSPLERGWGCVMTDHNSHWICRHLFLDIHLQQFYYL